MLLKFPNLETLRQALAKQIVPPTVSETAVTAAFDDQDQVWVDTPASLNRTVQNDLRKFSVQLPRSCSLKLVRYTSWNQLADSQHYMVFDDLQTFRLALTGKAVPRDVGQSPVTAGFDEQGRLWIETPPGLGQLSIRELRKLGVRHGPRCEAHLLAEVTCWPELLALVPDPNSTEHLEQTPVLFDLASGDRLAHLASEILRLGNDRQTFRWVEEQRDDGVESSRALLRVVGPPYYSLLRAIDRRQASPGREAGDALAPVAFVERAPRVWVELGYTHPLIDQIKLPPGKMLLVRPPRLWTLLEEAPFRDIYEVMEFALPDLPVAWHESELEKRIKVGLSLTAGGPAEGGELWVLRDNPVEELNRFVQNADDQLLHRLAFAVGKHDRQTTIIVRVRQSKLPPPVLVLNALAYRPYLKLPNLFLPCGKRLHPPLRRDQVRKLLAEDTSQVVWLLPVGAASRAAQESPARLAGPTADGSFTPQHLPEDSFRPLWDWTDYILDHEKEALQAWVQAAQFDFEPFICDEEPQSKSEKGSNSDRPRKSSPRLDQDDAGEVQFTALPRKDAKDGSASEDEDDILDAILVDQDQLQLRQELVQMEDRFQGFEGGLDIPERQALWPDLARLNAILGNTEDSGVCWLNALWAQDNLSQDWSWRWFGTEASAVSIPPKPEPGRPRGKNWTSRLALAEKGKREVNGDDLDWLLAETEPSTADLRSLAALIVWAARRTPPPQALLDRLNPIQRFLETNERLLPVRAVWLTWASLVQLSRGDVLALARTRDRLLERLYQNGLRPEQDLPSFLRFSGQPTSQRFRAVRQWLTQLADMAHRWVHEATQTGANQPQSPMDGYVDLVFSFGLARLGETDASRELLGRAQGVLGGENDVHQFLLGGFQHRIAQSLEGKPHAGPLPNEQLEYLEQMDRMPRYVVDRLRQHSRILEPNQRIDPYRHWSMRMSELDRELAELVDINDRKEVVNRVQRLLRDLPRGPKSSEDRSRILRSALDLAPRISEDFARELLELVVPTYDALPDPRSEPMALMERATFLEKALGVAAHFDRIEHIHPLVRRFQGLLQSQKGDRAIQAMESLAGQCFRGLRKLGMRDEIDQMLTLMANVILQGQDIQNLDTRSMPNAPVSLRALLHVAGGWFYFGRDRQAEPILQTVRSLLYRDELAYREKTALACVYAATVGQVSVDVAQKRLEEIFQKLTGIRDTYTTNIYYSLSQLDVIEAVVLAVASDDFTMGTQARRWLDDDEFIVRRRIHRDMRHLLAQH